MLPAWMVSLDGQEIFILKESVSVLPPVKQVFCSSPWMTVRCRPRSGNPANGGGDTQGSREVPALEGSSAWNEPLAHKGHLQTHVSPCLGGCEIAEE